MTTLTPGANAALTDASSITLQVATASTRVDLIALCLNDAGKADGDNGVALWSQPSCAGGAVTIDIVANSVTANLSALPADITKVLIVAQADNDAGANNVSDCGALTGTVTGGVTLTIPAPDAVPTVQVGELYRHGGGWKVRCLGDGYADGLAKLLTVHGIDVNDDADESAPAAQAPATPSAPVIKLTKGEDKLPPAQREKLSLRKKEVAKVLLTKGTPNIEARVIVVMDASGSMEHYRLYKGTMQESVRRCVAVAASMDDDGEMEAWRFATTSAQVPTLELGRMEEWIKHCVGMDRDVANDGQPGSSNQYSPTPTPSAPKRGLFGRNKAPESTPTAEPTPDFGEVKSVGGSNEEHLVIADIRKFVRENPLDCPTFVLFFSDGGVSGNPRIKEELLESQLEPIFWQFIGLGASNGYGILENFNTLPGRDIDNVGFCGIDGIDDMTDADLYALLLNEMPDWYKIVLARGIVRR